MCCILSNAYILLHNFYKYYFIIIDITILLAGSAVAYWFRKYVTSREVAGSRVVIIFSVYLILPAALGPAVYSASNRNEYQKQKNNVSGEKSAAGE
jgi:hypothetical protein